MRLDGHDRAIPLAATGKDDDMAGSLQICPHSGGLASKLRDADFLFHDLEVQLAGLVGDGDRVTVVAHCRFISLRCSSVYVRSGRHETAASILTQNGFPRND